MSVHRIWRRMQWLYFVVPRSVYFVVGVVVGMTVVVEMLVRHLGEVAR